MTPSELESESSPWMTPSEIVSHGFATSPVVMMNEAHNGWSRCARTRRVGREILPAAHDAGCRHLAMEALPNIPEPTLLTSPSDVGYLAQPEMREFVDAARGLGWTLVAYEIDYKDDALTMESTNRREQVQAENLVAAWQQIDRMPLLVWCGNSHHAKLGGGGWTPMGVRFMDLSGIAQFSIDQTSTISFASAHAPNIELTDDLRSALDARGGTAGFLAGNPPTGLEVPDHFDALILSTDNEMVGDPPVPRIRDFSEDRN
jgi:hypothetical protein